MSSALLMPLEEVFSPERLRFARERRGFAPQELAQLIGVSIKTVHRWENGDRDPSEENISALSKALTFPRAHFFAGALPTFDSARFRSLAKMTARQREKAKAAARQALQLDDWITKHFKRPKANLPDLRDTTPEDAAVQVRAAFGLGYRPVPNLVHLLEANGVRVYSLVHEGREVDALSLWYGETPFVFLNTVKTAERSRMDAGHELCHLLLHAHRDGPETREDEQEAQRFASAFLMPAIPFLASAPRSPSLPAINEAKLQWGVSAMAYVYRLHALDALSEWHYRTLCIEIKSKYPNAEPGHTRERETSQILAKVLAPIDGRSHRKKIIGDLLISADDFDAMTFGLSLTGIRGGASDESRSSSAARSSIQLVK